MRRTMRRLTRRRITRLGGRRIARVMVADLILYHRDQLIEGIKEGNVDDALSDEIAEARKTFESRVSEEVRNERDYLALELQKAIKQQAEGIAAE